MQIFTIGFTQTTAEHFFDRLRVAGVKRVVDVRLRNDSQLAGFAKARDLPYFLWELIGADFERTPSALLCSEPNADECHRSLVVSYLDDRWGEVEAVHL